MKQIIKKKKSNNQIIVVVFVDVKKAFDKVWHDGLIYKLIQMAVPHQLLNITRSFIYS